MKTEFFTFSICDLCKILNVMSKCKRICEYLNILFFDSESENRFSDISIESLVKIFTLCKFTSFLDQKGGAFLTLLTKIDTFLMSTFMSQ